MRRGGLRQIWDAALDVIYPIKCGMCGLFAESAMCDVCRSEFRIHVPDDQIPDHLSATHSLYRYEGRAAQAVQRLKYERVTSLAGPMAIDLSKFAAEHLDHVDLVVPVPIHWSRRCHRGFNQTELLCAEFQELNIDLKLLRRIRATRPQFKLTPDDRRINLAGAFQATRSLAGESILLIDDVTTSGHTASECAKTLREAGAGSVQLLTFASG